MDGILYFKELITGLFCELDKQPTSVQLELVNILEQLTKEWRVKNHFSRIAPSNRTHRDIDTDQSSECLPNKGNDEEFTQMRVAEDEQTRTKAVNESDTIFNEFLSAVDDGDHRSRSSTEVLQLFDFDEQRCLTLTQPLFSTDFSTATDCKHELEAFHPDNSVEVNLENDLQCNNNIDDLCKPEPRSDHCFDNERALDKKPCGDKMQPAAERKRKPRCSRPENKADDQSCPKQQLTICEICGARVKIIKVHMMQHGERLHTCPYCSYTSHQRGTVDVHIRRLHTNDRPHLCEICGKGFVKSSLLKDHISVKHNLVKRERSFVCSECKFSTFTRALLDAHVINRHKPYRRLVYKCDQCDAQLCSSHSLKEHLKLCHTDERPYPCTVCDFAAKSAKRLKNHMIYHSDKAFKCDTCGKMFFTQPQLRRHQLVHTRTMDFSCPYCSYQCSLAENLRKHCQAIHRVTYPAKKRLSYRRDFPKAKHCKAQTAAEHLSETVVHCVSLPEGLEMINCTA